MIEAELGTQTENFFSKSYQLLPKLNQRLIHRSQIFTEFILCTQLFQLF